MCIYQEFINVFFLLIFGLDYFSRPKIRRKKTLMSSWCLYDECMVNTSQTILVVSKIGIFMPEYWIMITVGDSSYDKQYTCIRISTLNRDLHT